MTSSLQRARHRHYWPCAPPLSTADQRARPPLFRCGGPRAGRCASGTLGPRRRGVACPCSTSTHTCRGRTCGPARCGPRTWAAGRGRWKGR
eukprot:2159351-Rhodomonas_salina.2